VEIGGTDPHETGDIMINAKRLCASVVAAALFGSLLVELEPVAANASATTSSMTSQAPASITMVVGTKAAGNAASLAGIDSDTLNVNSGLTGSYRDVIWYATFTDVPNDIPTLYADVYTWLRDEGDACVLRLHMWNYTLGGYDLIWSEDIDWFGTYAPAEGPAEGHHYVSGTTGPGNARVRIRCYNQTNAFQLQTDYVSLFY